MLGIGRGGGTSTSDGFRFRVFAFLLPLLLHAGRASAELPVERGPDAPPSVSASAEPLTAPYHVTELPIRETTPVFLLDLAPLGLTVSDSSNVHGYTFFTRVGLGVTHRRGKFVFNLLGSYEYSTRASVTFDAMASVALPIGVVDRGDFAPGAATKKRGPKALGDRRTRNATTPTRHEASLAPPPGYFKYRIDMTAN